MIGPLKPLEMRYERRAEHDLERMMAYMCPATPLAIAMFFGASRVVALLASLLRPTHALELLVRFAFDCAEARPLPRYLV